MRLFIGTPTNRNWSPYTKESFSNLERYISKQGIKNQNLEAFGVRSKPLTSNICSGRHHLIMEAVKGGFDHLLFIDDDMTFAPDCLDIMCNRGVDVIGANYVRRTAAAPFPTAFSLGLEPLTSAGKTGFEECESLGMGLFFINLKVLESVPLPFFEMVWLEAAQDIQGEDRYFCRKLRKHDIKVYVDHDVSQEVGHMGEFCYRFDSFSTN